MPGNLCLKSGKSQKWVVLGGSCRWNLNDCCQVFDQFAVLNCESVFKQKKTAVEEAKRTEEGGGGQNLGITQFHQISSRPGRKFRRINVRALNLMAGGRQFY